MAPCFWRIRLPTLWFQECLAATLGREHLFAGLGVGSGSSWELGWLDDDWMFGVFLQIKIRISHPTFSHFFLWLNIFLYHAFSLICGNDGRVVCSSITITVNLALCSHATRPPWPSMAFWRSSATSSLFNMLWDVYGFSDFQIEWAPKIEVLLPSELMKDTEKHFETVSWWLYILWSLIKAGLS